MKPVFLLSALAPEIPENSSFAMKFTRSQVMDVLSETFGHAAFREGQTEVIRSILNGGPAIAVLPTGAGKSLCYQLPALLFGGTTLVISPLIALMRDQVRGLNEKGVPAASLDSAQTSDERAWAEQAFVEGKLQLLYVSPERLGSERFLSLLNRIEVNIPFVAVDEAHCVARWGHDFRPAYLEIGPFLQRFAPDRVAAFTATATPELRDELGGALGLENADVFVRGFLRDNITIETRKMPNEDRRRFEAIELVRNRNAGGEDSPAPALVYAGTRRACEEMTEQLSHAGFRAVYYHGGCDGESRRVAQEMFLNNEVDALIATNAFGMGIDKPDIRMLIHLHMPRSFEDYYQEFGRCGRDGLPSRAVMLWRGKDYRTHDFLIKQPREDGAAADPRFVDASMRRLSRMFEWAQSGACSWRRVLEYFGDPAASDLADGCEQCCRCAAQAKNPPAALTGPKAQAAHLMLKAVNLWGVKYGRKKTVGILAGSRAVGIPTRPDGYGSLDGWRMTELEALVQALLDGGYLSIIGSEYPVLDATEKARKVLESNGEIFVSSIPASAGKGGSPSFGADPNQSEAEVSADPDLADALKRWRKSKADELGVPAFRIFSNKVLAQLASRAPETEADLLRVPGIGPGKVEAFGFELLGAIQEMVG